MWPFIPHEPSLLNEDRYSPFSLYLKQKIGKMCLTSQLLLVCCHVLYYTEQFYLLMPQKKNKQQQRKVMTRKTVNTIKDITNALSGTKQRKKNNKILNPSIELSECALKYAKAICDPWSSEAQGACIPVVPSRPTQKVAVFQRATMTIGTNGVGFVLGTPCLANDLMNLYTSTSTYTSTSSAQVAMSATNTITTVGVNGSYHNGPYSMQDIINGTQGVANTGCIGRVVSCAISVAYTGTELNKGGLLYCYASPDHHGLAGVSITHLGGRAETNIEGVKRSKCWVGTYPLRKEETEFFVNSSGSTVNQYNPLSNGTSMDFANNATATIRNGNPVLAVLATGTAGNTFQVEMVTHIEYIGPATEGRQTPAIADEDGYDLVSSAASRIPQLKVSKPGKTLGQYMLSALTEVTKELKPLAIGAVKAALVL